MKLLDSVALLEDQPEHHLKRGQVGTIVELLTEDVIEVEFVDEQGQTYALVPVATACLLHLHHQQVA
ncbi:MAG: DUF4926 domain-containing protein [Deinococcota bacterium]